jgi:myo-inositol-1(or 4)-monophosphatase
MARGAGELLSTYYGRLRRGDAERKGGRRRDLVSVADHEAERYLIDRIPATDDVLAEEGSERNEGGQRRWVVDPLDGTVNFLHGIPFWCISIAVVDDHELSAAVVHAPVLAQTFTATRGGGCFLNGEKVEVSRTAQIGEAILATGFAYNRNEVPDNNVDNWATMALEAAGLRRMGSAALDLAYVACGRLDGYWELHLSPWDVAAGALLVREAGGRVSDFSGREDVESVIGSRHVIGSNGALHEEIRSRLAPLRGL